MPAWTTMNRAVAVLIAVFAHLESTHAEETARAFDGAEVARLGAVYEKTTAQGRYETGQELAESQYFRGFVIGVALTGAKLGHICPPDSGVNFRALWTSTAAWLRENPEEWKQGPEEVVMTNLRKAYPCATKAEPVPENQEPAAQAPEPETSPAPQVGNEPAPEPEQTPND